MAESLYEISSQYQMAFHELSEILADTEMSEEEVDKIIADSLTDLQGKFDDKALAVAAFIRNLEVEAESIDIVIKRLTARRKAVIRKSDSLKEYLFNQMLFTQTTAIKNAQLVLTIKNNPAKVELLNEEVIPSKYKTTVSEVKISKTAIANDIKAGIEVEGAIMVQSQRLDIK